jgi:hypothetical protein
MFWQAPAQWRVASLETEDLVMCNRRLPAVLILVVLTLAAFAPMANAASLSNSERAQASGLAAHLEFWLFNTIERVEAVFGFKERALPAPGQGSNPPSMQSDCRSAIDPNGGTCAP